MTSLLISSSQASKSVQLFHVDVDSVETLKRGVIQEIPNVGNYGPLNNSGLIFSEDQSLQLIQPFYANMEEVKIHINNLYYSAFEKRNESSFSIFFQFFGSLQSALLKLDFVTGNNPDVSMTLTISNPRGKILYSNSLKSSNSSFSDTERIFFKHPDSVYLKMDNSSIYVSVGSDMLLSMQDSFFQFGKDNKILALSIQTQISPWFTLGFSSLTIDASLSDYQCSNDKTCNGHGKCLPNPVFDNEHGITSWTWIIKECVCDVGFNGSFCENYEGIQAKKLQLFRAQSLSTNESHYLEHVFDVGNANAAPAAQDAGYACNDHNTDDFGVALYTIELDSNFRGYQPFNDDSSYGSSEDFDTDYRVGYDDGTNYYSFPEQSRCKPCDSIGTNNCRWKIISVDKIVRSRCLIDYAKLRGNQCYQLFPESFYNCSDVGMYSSKEFVKGQNRPSHCPQVISGCVGETFPSAISSEDGCAHECIPCSKRYDLAYPSVPQIESLMPTGIALSWNKVESNLYGDSLREGSIVSYSSRLISEYDESFFAIKSSEIPAVSFSNLKPSQKYSVYIRAISGSQESQETRFSFMTPQQTRTESLIQ